MAVDDAGTLDQGGAKIEWGISRDALSRGWDGTVGFSPIENLELEANFERQRDHASDPSSRLRSHGLALKWVPLQQDVGLSAGLKLELGRTKIENFVDPVQTERTDALNGLLSWRFQSGHAIHFNLGHEWHRTASEHQGANTWGVGFEHPLAENLQLTVETYGAARQRPDKQVGLRWEIAEGLKLSVAAGRGNGRSFGNAGVAWEF